jgi:uncharacterized membrane protein YeaQ/YmgE (transglycosylase-associated protein family)
MALNILGWLIIGLLAGWLANQIMGSGSYGIVGDIIIGLIGALIGGWLAGVLFNRPLDFSAPFSFDNFLITLIIALIGAILFIALLRALSGRRNPV